MEIQGEKNFPKVYLRQIATQQNQFTPISAFLSLCSLILPFTSNPTSVIPFLLILAPLYINRKNYILAVLLIICSIFWPFHQKHRSQASRLINSTQNQVIMRMVLIINAVYMIVSYRKMIKYRLTPLKVNNSHFPVVF